MSLIKNLIIFFRYFLKARWIFKLPKKNNFVLVDGIYNPFLKYIKKKNITILYRRGEEINFSIILKCLMSLKLTTLNYAVEFIKEVSPKLILTAFDYHTIFYKLSQKTKIKTLMLQYGKRVSVDKHILNSNLFFPKNSKKIFNVDYALVYNSTVKKFYSKRINGNFFEIGNFANNFTKPDLNKKKNEIVFISNYSPITKEKNKSENENFIAHFLLQLASKNNINFNILPRFRKTQKVLIEEKNFYKKTLKNNFKFILNKNKTSYDLLLNYKYIFSSYSSLAQECLVKGMRVGFVCFKSKKNPVSNFRFGKFEKLKKEGLFWTYSNKLNFKETNRVFNFVTKTKDKMWIKKTNPYSKRIMAFDYKNKTFNKILKKYNNSQ
jgi:surface carbohydrate biosynthesis protein